MQKLYLVYESNRHNKLYSYMREKELQLNYLIVK